LPCPDDLGEIFEIDLVANTGSRWHDTKVVEGFRAPAKEGVAFTIPLIFELNIALERTGLAKHIHLDRMIDHQIDGRLRIDLIRVATKLNHGLAHRGKVDHSGHASEVLHQHAGRTIGDFLIRAAVFQPSDHCLDILALDRATVFIAKQVFQENLQRIGQTTDIAKLCRCGFQREVIIGRAADIELLSNPEAVLARDSHLDHLLVSIDAKAPRSHLSLFRRFRHRQTKVSDLAVR